MPPLETMDMYDRAVLMEFVRQDDDGQIIAREAEEIDCRWEDGQSEAIDPQGNVIRIDATVVVDRFVPVDSILWKGEAVDWYGTGSGGGSDPELMRVVRSPHVPDLKGRHVRRALLLQRYRGTKPTQVD